LGSREKKGKKKRGISYFLRKGTVKEESKKRFPVSGRGEKGGGKGKGGGGSDFSPREGGGKKVKRRGTL